MNPLFQEVPTVDSLIDPDTLRILLGGLGAVRVEALHTLGYSGSQFFRVTLDRQTHELESFIVKRTILNEDWFSNRTQDLIGREAAVLLAPQFARIRQIFHLPYRAVAVETGQFAVLMDDVSTWLLPDERVPLAREDEDLILRTLAQLHATFWQSSKLEELTWLHKPADFLYIMGPHGHGDPESTGGSARQVHEAVRVGWQVALELLPDATRRALCRPTAEIAASWSHLPVTLIHGDAKIANFAVLPNRRLCALDWAFVGWAPCTFELGWYLAVNASRLSDTKEYTLIRYRGFLESHLGFQLEDELWETLEEVGLVCGGLMLLWSKGAAVAAGRPSAELEWAWWEGRLSKWASSLR